MKDAAIILGDSPDALNELAWLLANWPDPQFRDPARAVELARKAIEQCRRPAIWNTLGVAEYRSGAWDKAIKALSRSMELTSGGSAVDWLFLAMAHWQKGEKNEARSWFDKAVSSMDKNQSKDEESIRFRAEATALLGRTSRRSRPGRRYSPLNPDAMIVVPIAMSDAAPLGAGRRQKTQRPSRAEDRTRPRDVTQSR